MTQMKKEIKKMQKKRDIHKTELNQGKLLSESQTRGKTKETNYIVKQGMNNFWVAVTQEIDHLIYSVGRLVV